LTAAIFELYTCSGNDEGEYSCSVREQYYFSTFSQAPYHRIIATTADAMPSTRTTKIGGRIEATANLLTTSSVLGDIINIARNELIEAVKEGNQRKALAAVKIIDRTLSSVKKRVRDEAYGTAQVSASKIDYAAKRMAVEEKRRDSLNPIRKSLRKSDAFVACEKFIKTANRATPTKLKAVAKPVVVC
jgi:hypothetical protein